MGKRLFSAFKGRSVELLFFGGTGQGFHRRRTALDHGGHVVEVTCADFLLVRHEGVALVACCEFRLLHHFHVVLHAFAASVCMGELEGVVPVDMDAGQRDELVLVAQCGQLFLEGSDLAVVEVLLPVKRWRAVVRQQLAGGRQRAQLARIHGRSRCLARRFRTTPGRRRGRRPRHG